MQLVEQHIIDRSHLYFAEIDLAAFASKNLYNLANYTIRQEFITNGNWLRYDVLASILKTSDAYKALPAKVAQWVLKMLDKNWQSFFAATKEYKVNPGKFLGRPKLPQYKDKESGRNLLVYTIQAISLKLLRIGQVKPSGLNVFIKTTKQNIDQVRIVPRKNHYVVEIVHTVEEEQKELDYALVAGIDLGIDNLAAITSNKPGFTPLLVNGRGLKSINQFYNKRKAELQSILGSDKATSHRIDRLADKRNRRVDSFLHTASRRIVDLLVKEQIGVLVIGRNPEWKQDVNLGKATNQKFVQIPHARFVNQLTYKCQLVGVKVIEREESYTSKTSFLDNEPICKSESYIGKRVKRGLFRSGNGTLINADVNGSYNIIRKAFPAAFDVQGIEGAVVRPLPFGTN